MVKAPLLHRLIWMVVLWTYVPAALPVIADDSQPLCRWPMDLAGRQVFAPVRVGDREYPFIVDTGSQRTVIDVSLVKTLGDPIAEVIDPSRPIDQPAVYGYSAAQMTVGMNSFPTDSRIIALDLRRVQACMFFCRDTPRGILGMDFLKSYRLTFNFDAKLCTLERSTEATTGEWMGDLELIGEPPHPFIRAKIGSAESQLWLIDTGANSSLAMPNPLFNDLLIKGEIVDTASCSITGIDYVDSVPMGRVKSFTIGPFVHYGMAVANFGPPLIGMNYLVRYNMVMDFPRKRVGLTPNKRFYSPDHKDWDGLRINGGRITEVVQSSDGESAGFRVGDRIIRIRNIDIDMVPDILLQESIAMRHADLSITIERDGTEVPLMLKYASSKTEQKGVYGAWNR